MTDYLKLFNEVMAEGLPADVEGPGTDSWYTKGIPAPGDVGYTVSGQGDQGAIPPRSQAQPTQAQPAQAQPGPVAEMIDYGRILQGVMNEPQDDAMTSRMESEKYRKVMDKAAGAAVYIPTGGPIGEFISNQVESATGVSLKQTSKDAVKGIAGGLFKTLDMLSDVGEEALYDGVIGAYDTFEHLRRGLRTPGQDEPVPVLNREQLRKHLDARLATPGFLDKGVDLKIFEDTAEEELRKMDRNDVQMYIEDVLTTGQEMIPQVAAFLLGSAVAGPLGGKALSAAWMSTQISGPIYQQKVDEGKRPVDAFKQAIVSAAGQSILESWGMGKWMNTGGVSMLKRFAKGGLAEGGTEWLQEYWDLAADIWYDDPKREAVFKALDDAWDKGENPFTKEGEIYDKIREDFWDTFKSANYSFLVAFPLGGAGGAVKARSDKKVAQRKEKQAALVTKLRKLGHGNIADQIESREENGITDEDINILTGNIAGIDEVVEKSAGKADVNNILDKLYQKADQPPVTEEVPVEQAPVGEQTPEEYFGVDQDDAIVDSIKDVMGVEETADGLIVQKKEEPAAEPLTPSEKLKYKSLIAKKGELSMPETLERKKLRQKYANYAKTKALEEAPIDQSLDIEGEHIRTPAVRYRGKIYEGQNHLEAYEKLKEDIGGDVPDVDFIDGKLEDGFLTSEENFLDRDDGFDLANEMGQLKEGEEFKRGYLVSEALEEPDIKVDQQIDTIITPGLKRDETGRVADIIAKKDILNVEINKRALEDAKYAAGDKWGEVVGRDKDGRLKFEIKKGNEEKYRKYMEPFFARYEDALKGEVTQQVAPKAKKAPAKKAKKTPVMKKKVAKPPPLKAKAVTQPPKKAKAVLEKAYGKEAFEYHEPKGMVQQAIKAFAGLVGRGKKVYFFTPTEKYKKIKGIHTGDRIFVSVHADPGWHTYAHESLHDMKTTRKDLYEKLMELVEPHMDAELLASYGATLNDARAKMDQPALDVEAIKEEYVAEYVGIQVRNKAFWRDVRKKSLELFDRLAKGVMKLIDASSGGMWLDKYQDYMFTDADKVRGYIADAYADFWGEDGIKVKAGKKIGQINAAKVSYATENVQQNLDPKMVRSVTENKVLSDDNVKVLNLLGEAGAIDDLLGAQLTEQKYFTQEFMDKAKKKYEESKIADKGDADKLAKAKAKFETAKEKYKRSKNMSREEVASILTRDERPSYMNISRALKNNKELKKRVDSLDKQLKKLSPGASLYEEDGSFKHHPIEERTKPDADNVFNLLPKFGGFRRNISQTFVDQMDDKSREKFRKEIVSWVEEAHRKGIEPQLFGRNLQEGTDKQYPLAPALRKAHKTLGALSLNGVCPMFNIGNHGCYLDGCYLTGMGAGGNGVNFYRTAMYMGEILQLKADEIKALNDVGGLRINGIGDTEMAHLPQFRDFFKHAAMRKLKIKIITKQPVTFEIMDTLQKDKDRDVSTIAKSTVIQPTVDPYWTPVVEDDFKGSGVDAMGIRKSAEKFGPQNAADSFEKLLGREAKVINGQVYRKYGFGWDQLKEMSKKYPTVKTQPRLVVGTFREIAEYALKMPKAIQTWMHASIRPGMYSEIDGKVLGEGEVGNFTKRVKVSHSKDGIKIEATDTKGKVIAGKTYTALENFLRTEYNPEQQKEIANVLVGQNKKDPSALCCRAGASLDACMDCTSHCHNGTNYTGTKLGKIAETGAQMQTFPEEVDAKQDLSIPEETVASELPEEFDKTMRERGIRVAKSGVGKDIGGSVYVHKGYEGNIPDIEVAKEKLPDDFKYTVVKWNKSNGSITFTKVEDFNSAEEPTVGDQFLVKEDGSTRYMKANKDPWIYHHKWTMVGEDYVGFDILQSKLRSLQWTDLGDVDTSRAGKWSFWQANVIPRLGELAKTSSSPDKVIVSQQVSPVLKNQRTQEQLEKIGWTPDMQMYTQIPTTLPTYKKVAAWMKKHGIKGSETLDYSAGLGKGSQAIKSKSFEPFPDPAKDFKPDWSDPKAIDQKFKFIFNNATMNVMPGDIRAGVIDHIASLLDTGGQAIIAARGRDLVKSVKNPLYINESTGEVLTNWRKRDGRDIATYQKGYAGNRELGEEIISQLGNEYTWASAPKELGLSIGVVIARKSDAKISQQVDMGDIWYSQMENVIWDKVQTGPSKQIKSNLLSWAKKGQFKMEELEYSGLLEWLDTLNRKVDRNEVREFVSENHVEITEKLMEDDGEIASLHQKKKFADIYLAKAEQWLQEEQGDGDVFDEMPEDVQQAFIDYEHDQTLAAKDIIDDYLDGLDIDFHELNIASEEALEEAGGKPRYGAYVTPGGRLYKELLIRLPKNKSKFVTTHWGDIENVLSHVRFNERIVNGKKVLFIEEIQSDWHQKGRKKGYETSDRFKLARAYEEAIDEIRNTTDDAVNIRWMKNNTDKLTELQKKALDLWKKQEKLGGYESAYDTGIPDAPFKKTWKLLTIKRMVKYAADNGFDSIGWTDGKTQADRYDLSKHYKLVSYHDLQDGTYTLSGKTVSGQDIDITKDGAVSEDALENYVGKDIAEKIIAGEGKNQAKYGFTYGEFRGVDLKVGGRGMAEFYDKILVNEFNGFFRKGAWGKMEVVDESIENPMYAPTQIKVRLGGDGRYWTSFLENGEWVDEFAYDTKEKAEAGRKEQLSEMQDVPKTINIWKADLTQDTKSKASMETMPMFNLDIGSDIDPATEKLLNEKFGREDRTIADRVWESLKEFWSNKTTRVVDRLHPIKEKLGGEGTAYMLHRGLPGVQSVLNALMAHGKLAWDASKAIVTKERHKGFLPWIKDLGPDAEKAFYWIMVKRAEALDVEGREHWLTKDVRDQILKWVGNPTGKKSWEQINTEFQEWNKNVLNLAVESGLLSEEQTKEWMSDFYIPFYRVFEDPVERLEYLKGPNKGKINLSAQIKRLQGAEAKIGDPFENILRNWSHLVSESMSNRARSEAYQYGVDNKVMSGLTRIDEDGNEVPVPMIEEVGWADTVVFKKQEGGSTFVSKKTGDEILSFKKDGKPVFFKVNDPELFQALSLVNRPYVDNILMKSLSGAKRMLTAGATFGPAFRVANMLRDTLHTFQITEGWSFKPMWSTAKGFVSAWREDQNFVEFMSSGHAFGGSYVRAEDPKALEKYVNRIANSDKVSVKTAASRILDTPKKMLEFWSRIGEASENAARVALYTSLKKEGKTHLESAFAARDLMDFQMSGNSNVVGFLIGTVPFLNARMQGLYRMGRAAHENPKTFFFKGAMIFAATMLLWLNNRDDEEYKALEAWDKFAYYHFWIGDKHFRIPKPFETGVVFSTAWEAMADSAVGNEEADHLWEFTKHALGETFAFNPIPQGVRPLAEQWANKSFFTGRPIESQFQQKLKPGERYDPWTSETLIMAGKLGIPPKRAQALIRGYFADIGMGLLAASDLAVRTFGDFPDRPAKRIDEYPMIGRFVRESKPARNVKYMTKFWESMDELDKLNNTVNMYKNSGDFEGAQRVANANRKLLQMRPGLNAQRQKIRKVSYEIKRIWKDPVLTADEKRVKIDKLVELRNELVKTIYNSYLKET